VFVPGFDQTPQGPLDFQISIGLKNNFNTESDFDSVNAGQTGCPPDCSGGGTGV